MYACDRVIVRARSCHPPNTWNKSSRWTRLLQFCSNIYYIWPFDLQLNPIGNIQSDASKLVTLQWNGMKYTAHWTAQYNAALHSPARNRDGKKEQEEERERKSVDRRRTDPSIRFLAWNAQFQSNSIHLHMHSPNVTRREREKNRETELMRMFSIQTNWLQ